MFILSGVSVFEIWPLIENIANIHNIEGYFVATVELIIAVIPVMVAGIVMGKSIEKEREIQYEIRRIENDIIQRNIIKSIKTRFELLSIERKLELLNYIKGDILLSEIFEEIDTLDKSNIQILQQELDGYISLEQENVSGYSRKRTIETE